MNVVGVTLGAPGARAAEALRLLVGLVAGGHDVRVLEAGTGRWSPTDADDVPREVADEIEDYLRGLEGLGVRLEHATDEDLREALLACEAVLRVAPPHRPGRPAVLELTDAVVRSSSPAALLALMAEAGQVIRAR